MSATVTDRYSRMHTAFLEASRKHGLWAFDVRLLVALLDRDWRATQVELSDDLCNVVAAARRSLSLLETRGLVVRTRGPRRSVNVELTRQGAAVAMDALRKAGEA